MTDAAHRGRTKLIAIVALGAGIFALVSAMSYVRGEPHSSIGQIGRPLVMLLLGIQAYRGRNWARRVLAAWFAILTFGMTAGAMSAAPNALAVAVFLAFAGVYVALVGLLLASDDVAEFMAAQRAGGGGAAPEGRPEPRG